VVDIHTARTALYRLYDEGGVLLYVGITNMPQVRFAAHTMKPWWKRVTRKDIAWFENRPLAEQAETLAIREERPLYNLAKSPWRSTAEPAALADLPQDLDELDIEIGTAARQRLLAKKELEASDRELKALVAEGRASGLGPSHMAKLTGFTREWVAKIAPDPKRARDIAAARTVAES
jgi:hypothetical protein